MAESGLTASVVIAAYNAKATIAQCIEAVLQQSVPRSQFEVIIVDDGSTDDTRKMIASRDVKILCQPHRGVGAARNLGVEQAQGEIILFTDADCAPAHDWVETLIQPFHDSEISGAKGVYKTYQSEVIARFAQLEYEDKYDKMKKEKYIDFVDTYCAAYRKSIFSKDGGFDPAFRRSGEDIEFSYRLAERGYKMVFIPQAIVYHHHVDSLWGYLKRKFYVGYWRVLMYQKHPGKIWKDSHTPQFLKIQVALALLFFALCPLVFFRRDFLLAPAITTLLFVATTFPFMVKSWPKDRAVTLLSPLLLFLRACALALGLMAGLFGRLLEKRARES